MQRLPLAAKGYPGCAAQSAEDRVDCVRVRLRAVFLFLILANLLFFAWAQGYFGGKGEGREPQRLANQLAPDRLRIVGSVAPSAVISAPPEICRQVSGLAQLDAQRLRAQAEEKFPGLRVVLRSSKQQPIYWVLIPSLANRLVADKKLAELKQLGLKDFSVVLEEGSYKFAISLGQFANEHTAGEFLQGIEKRGVKSAKLLVRENQAEVTPLEVRGPAALLDRQLPLLLAGQAGASIGDCPVGQ